MRYGIYLYDYGKYQTATRLLSGSALSRESTQMLSAIRLTWIEVTEDTESWSAVTESDETWSSVTETPETWTEVRIQN